MHQISLQEFLKFLKIKSSSWKLHRNLDEVSDILKSLWTVCTPINIHPLRGTWASSNNCLIFICVLIIWWIALIIQYDHQCIWTSIKNAFNGCRRQSRKFFIHINSVLNTKAKIKYKKEEQFMDWITINYFIYSLVISLTVTIIQKCFPKKCRKYFLYKYNAKNFHFYF